MTHCARKSLPEDVERLSQLSMLSLVQSRRHAEDADSDSGDSLFITQLPAHETISRRPMRSHFGSDRHRVEHEEDESSSAEKNCSYRPNRKKKKKKKKKKSFSLPKFSFSFLQVGLKNNLNKDLPSQLNRKLHNYAMGGFLRCVQDMCDSYHRGHDLMASLPTVDMDGEPISPISEGEDETEADGNFRVVEKKRFVAAVSRISKPWSSVPKTRENNEAKNELPKRQWKMNKVKRLTSSVNASTSSAVHKLEEEETQSGKEQQRLCDDREDVVVDEGETLHSSVEANQTELNDVGEKKKKQIGGSVDCDVIETTSEEKFSDLMEIIIDPNPTHEKKKMMDATQEIHNPTLGSVGSKTKRDGDDGCLITTATEEGKIPKKKDKNIPSDLPQTQREHMETPGDGLNQSQTSHGTSESNFDKSKKHKKRNKLFVFDSCKNVSTSVEQADLTAKKMKRSILEVENCSSTPVEEPQGEQTEVESKKKKKKDKNVPSDLPQTQEEHLESSGDGLNQSQTSHETFGSNVDASKRHKKRNKLFVFDDSCKNVSTSVEQADLTAKKMKRSILEVENCSSTPVEEPQGEQTEVESKKKKKKDKNIPSDLPQTQEEHLGSSGDGLNNSQTSHETFGSNCVQRKRHKKKSNLSVFDGCNNDLNLAKVPDFTARKRKNTEVVRKKKKRGFQDPASVAGSDCFFSPRGEQQMNSCFLTADGEQNTALQLSGTSAEATEGSHRFEEGKRKRPGQLQCVEKEPDVQELKEMTEAHVKKKKKKCKISEPASEDADSGTCSLNSSVSASQRKKTVLTQKEQNRKNKKSLVEHSENKTSINPKKKKNWKLSKVEAKHKRIESIKASKPFLPKNDTHSSLGVGQKKSSSKKRLHNPNGDFLLNV